MKKRYITIPMLILLLAPTILSLLMGAEFVHLPFQKVPTIIVNHDHSETDTFSLVSGGTSVAA